MTAESDYCVDLVRRHDRDRFLTVLFAPADRRADLCALYAFNWELARVRETVSEPMLGEIRLQWWREAIDGIYTGSVRRHEVAVALADAIERRGLKRTGFDKLIDARAVDLSEHGPASMLALKRYAEESSANLVVLALDILGHATGAPFLAGRHVGIAWALVGLLRAVPFHAASRRLYLPLDQVRAAGIDIETLFAGRAGPAIAPVVAEVAAEARGHLVHARSQGAVPKSALSPLLAARQTDLYLHALEQAGYDPFALPATDRIRAFHAARLAWAAWRGRF